MDAFFKSVYMGLIQYGGSILGLCILFAILALLLKIKSEMVNKVVELSKALKDYNHGASVKKSVSCDRDINIELSRLLFGAKASRVGLFLFHNGTIFNTNSPIWKVSSTHEVCETGVSQEIGKVQDIKASLLTPLMSPMFTGSDNDGVIKIRPERCPLHGKACPRDAYIFRVSPEQINNSYSQTFLVNRGTKFALMSPLLNWDSNIVGFVFLEYCHEGFMTEEELCEVAHLACRTTSRVFQIISDLDTNEVIESHQRKSKRFSIFGRKKEK